MNRAHPAGALLMLATLAGCSRLPDCDSAKAQAIVQESIFRAVGRDRDYQLVLAPPPPELPPPQLLEDELLDEPDEDDELKPDELELLDDGGSMRGMA